MATQMIDRPDLMAAINENIAEMRDGVHGPSSKFRLVCCDCGNVVDRGLAVGSPCPFFVGRKVKCQGTLIPNPRFKG